jgi:GNAT superfamily N-acetyltransferase
MDIRQATQGDRPHLIRMRLALQDHLESSNPRLWRITPQGKPFQEKYVDDFLRDEWTYVAEHDGAPVAYIHGVVEHRTHLTPAAVGLLNGIYVDPPHRRQGTATALVATLLRRFQEHGATEVNLRYIIGNPEGEKFWNRLGLTPNIITANAPLQEVLRRLEK